MKIENIIDIIKTIEFTKGEAKSLKTLIDENTVSKLNKPLSNGIEGQKLMKRCIDNNLRIIKSMANINDTVKIKLELENGCKITLFHNGKTHYQGKNVEETKTILEPTT